MLSGIEEVIDSVEELLKEGHAAEVISLAEYALEAVEEAMGSVDDSDGDMGSILRAAPRAASSTRARKPNPTRKHWPGDSSSGSCAPIMTRFTARQKLTRVSSEKKDWLSIGRWRKRSGRKCRRSGPARMIRRSTANGFGSRTSWRRSPGRRETWRRSLL